MLHLVNVFMMKGGDFLAQDFLRELGREQELISQETYVHD